MNNQSYRFDTIKNDVLTLDLKELGWVQTKKINNQLAFAVMLKFFQWEGRYPDKDEVIPPVIIVCLANQLGVDPSKIEHFNWEGRSAERFRQAIRRFLGYRKPTVADSKKLMLWLNSDVLPQAPTLPQCLEKAYQFFHDHQLEPFSKKELDRYIHSATYHFEEQFFSTIDSQLSAETKKIMDALIKDTIDRDEDDEEADIDQIKLHHLKRDMAGAKLKHVHFEIKKLNSIRRIFLPVSLLHTLSRKYLQRYYLRILSESPSHIEEYKVASRYGSMAAFCYIRSQLLTDNLSDVLMQFIHKIQKSSETHVIKKVISEIKRVDGKFDILYELANTAAAYPDGVIQDKIYPKVSQETLCNLADELRSRCKGKWYQTQVQIKMRSLYSHAHRQVILPLLDAFTFHTNTPAGRALLQAVTFIQNNKNISNEYYPDTQVVPIESVIPHHWRSAVLGEISATDRPDTPNTSNTSSPPSYKVNRMNYEMAVLEELRRQLRCKLIWIEGSYRYRNPDEDSPKDFDDRKEYYYQLLNLPLDPEDFVQSLQSSVNKHLQELNDTILGNDKVKLLTTKEGKGGKIKLSPSEPQDLPVNIKALQNAIRRRWSPIHLLDMLKEVDLRIHLTRHLQTVARKTSIGISKLRKRLLLCIYAIGSNTGLMRISAANRDANYSDLKYTKRRYLHTANVRAAIVDVVNHILKIRDPLIWGEGTTGVACDSTQVSSWDQNLMTEWHPRYHGHGVMVYWHVDKKSAVIHSQLKTCTSSEVGSMITGVLKHDTNMNMNEVYVDTHGQSSIGFCFSYMLHFDLLPRLKNINKQKLYYSSASHKKNYPNLAAILKEPIHWELIKENYHEIVRLVAALKTGTAEAEVIIKRFSQDNYNHPVYKAMDEIGKAVKTIFLCRYLSSEALRIEIHEALNVVERLNSVMHFIFYGKLGEIATNNKDNQELSIVCLHLLQVCMVYINTLIIQEALSDPVWKDRLTDEDKRALTPLIYKHINPYGLFPLDMEERLIIERRDPKKTV